MKNWLNQVESIKYKYIFFIPQIITGIRIILCFLFLYIYLIHFIEFAIIVLGIAVATDIIDGKLARKLDVCTKFGFYFDVIADFLLIFNVFTAFVIEGIFPVWLLLLISFMFFQFIITTNFKKPVYDPIGKYLFLILIIVAFITFFSIEPIVCSINCFFLLGFSVISLILRYYSLSKIT